MDFMPDRTGWIEPNLNLMTGNHTKGVTEEALLPNAIFCPRKQAA
jgi:hypothetical protein